MICGWISMIADIGRVPSIDCRARLSIRESRIEPLRGFAENPAALLRTCLRERGLGLAENSGKRVGGCGKVRAPGNAVGAEGLDQFVEECFRARFAPLLGRDIERRDLQKNIRVARKIEEFLIGC